MGLWIQLAFEVSSLILLPFSTRTPSDLKLDWTPAGGKDSFGQQRETESQILDSFSSVVSWRLKKAGFASGEGWRECRPSQRVPQPLPSVPYSSPLPPQAHPVRVKHVPFPSQVGPQPHSREGECGICHPPCNPLPMGGCWLSFVLQLQTKPQVRSSQISVDSVIFGGVY